MAAEEAPSAVTAACPGCGQEALQTVLRGRQSRTSAVTTIDATVQCTECERVHHVVLKEPAPIDVTVVISKGQQSRRTKAQLYADDELEIGDIIVVDGMNCKLTGIEDNDARRVDAAAVRDVTTLWTKEFEELAVKFAINLNQKTITKVIEATPDETFTVGTEFLFGRLRVTVHAIKTEERLLKRGSAEAGEIIRIFAAPTPLGERTHRPDKRSRQALRETEEHRR
ncbi:MAG TPA: HVO_0476 family zinc finger protein [Candidatus Limnocylindrales bacterium]|nr:HVO_0476 family zinc finger protein [Candidatus Limnocylindrales bacterium]